MPIKLVLSGNLFNIHLAKEKSGIQIEPHVGGLHSGVAALCPSPTSTGALSVPTHSLPTGAAQPPFRWEGTQAPTSLRRVVLEPVGGGGHRDHVSTLPPPPQLGSSLFLSVISN